VVLSFMKTFILMQRQLPVLNFGCFGKIKEWNVIAGKLNIF